MAVKEENKIENYKNLITKLFGKNSDILIKDPKDIQIEKFSTGSYLLDRDLKGGYPKGTLIELFGGNSSGKTSSCIHAVAEHQSKYPDEPVLWVDLEKVFDPVYFTNIGIDVGSDNFILVRPTAGEDACETMINFAKTFENGIIVLDSVALLLHKKEYLFDYFLSATDEERHAFIAEWKEVLNGVERKMHQTDNKLEHTPSIA